MFHLLSNSDYCYSFFWDTLYSVYLLLVTVLFCTPLIIYQRVISICSLFRNKSCNIRIIDLNILKEGKIYFTQIPSFTNLNLLKQWIKEYIINLKTKTNYNSDIIGNFLIKYFFMILVDTWKGGNKSNVRKIWNKTCIP